MADLEKITHFDGIMIKSGTENGGIFNVNSTLNPPSMTTAQRDKLENTNNKAAPIKKGTLVYNEEANSVQAFQGADAGAWVSLGAGGGAGTVTPVGTTANGGLVTNMEEGAAITVNGTIGLAENNVGKVGDIVLTQDGGGAVTLTINAQGLITNVVIEA